MSSSPRRARRDRGIGYLVSAAEFTYQQFTAISTAVALAMMVHKYLHIEWYGIFAHVFGFWDLVVRPLVKDILDLALAPLKVVGWHVEVPLLARDYIAVGLNL